MAEPSLMPLEELGSSAMFDCVVFEEDGMFVGVLVVVRLDDATEEEPPRPNISLIS
jgi:hypothetical protein